jgi:hypothetical protein
MALNISAEIEAMVKSLGPILNPILNSINTLQQAALQESAAALQIGYAELLIKVTWLLFVMILVIDIALCMVYAGLRARNKAMPGRCLCAILSFPLSLVVLVYVRQGSGVVFGYKLSNTLAPTEDNFPLEGPSDRVRIVKSPV